MFEYAGDDLSSCTAMERGCRPEDGEVVGFGAAAGEEDFVRLSPDQLGDPGPGPVQNRARFLSEGMEAGRVAVGIPNGIHLGPYERVEGCGGVMVEEDGFHGARAP